MSVTLQQERIGPDWPRLVVAIAASAYFLWAVLHPHDWRLIDGVNLIVHEAGHIIFMPFGEFVMIAGGSIFQVLVPLIFALYFYYHGNYYSSALVSLWTGESLLNVSIYAGDAIEMQLPLLGGNDSIHDWNYLLDHLGWLSSTSLVAQVLSVSASLIIIGASLWALLSALRSTRKSYL